MANTTWNPSDKSVGITLTGSNLIATNNNNAFSGVRTIDRQISGKFYWEVTYNTVTSASSAAGIIDAVVLVSSTLGAAPIGTRILGITQGGQCTGGMTSPFTLGTITAGTVVCFAVDSDARLFWARSGAAGNWNAAASANPATSAGGVSLATVGLGGGVPLYPWVMVGNTNDRMTANFGDTAFTGTVPAGFTSGFTAGASIPTNALATQLTAEQWFSTNPNMQLTQIAVEHWVTVIGSPEQGLVTQIALEQWASVASVSETQSRVWILA